MNSTGKQNGAPPRHRLALLTWLGAYPVITAILGLLGPSMVGWPLAVRTLVVSVLMVTMLTWVIMPGLTRLGRSWLMKPTQRAASTSAAARLPERTAPSM
jgi:antibiotic biosynthesis monooxygenase (ABM) superfamily enzyme